MDYGGVNGTTEALNLLENFWPRITREIQNLTSVNIYFILIIKRLL